MFLEVHAKGWLKLFYTMKKSNAALKNFFKREKTHFLEFVDFSVNDGIRVFMNTKFMEK
jgi:hypothetical protein